MLKNLYVSEIVKIKYENVQENILTDLNISTNTFIINWGESIQSDTFIINWDENVQSNTSITDEGANVQLNTSIINWGANVQLNAFIVSWDEDNWAQDEDNCN